MRRAFLLIVLFVLVVALLPSDCARAQGGRTGLSPEDQKKYDDLIRSAKRGQSIAVLAMQVAAVSCGLVFVYGAYSTLRNGFKVSATKRIQGTGARIIAVALLLVGIGVAVVGIIYASSVMP